MKKRVMEAFGLRKADCLLLGILLAVSIVLMLVLPLHQSPGERVVVRVSGEERASYSLWEPRQELIRGSNGGTNLLIIEDGSARVEEASCPDGLCIHQGAVRRSGESIICLPNEVVVEIVGAKEDTDVDVVVK